MKEDAERDEGQKARFEQIAKDKADALNKKLEEERKAQKAVRDAERAVRDAEKLKKKRKSNR